EKGLCSKTYNLKQEDELPSEVIKRGKIGEIGKIGKHSFPSIENVLFVEGLKHNLLRISQLCRVDMMFLLTKENVDQSNGDVQRDDESYSIHLTGIFLKFNIFCRFGVPKAVISDQGSHFYNRAMSSLLHKYRVVSKIATTYHPQTNGQAKVFNREIKRTLQKMTNPSRKDWS
ncbi:Pol polyprotein, partial [Mucuna pruriens]